MTTGQEKEKAMPVLSMTARRWRPRSFAARIAATAIVVVACAGVASGTAAAAPVWSLIPAATTNVAAGGTLEYLIAVANLGDAATSGDPSDPIVLTVTLPVGSMTGASVVDLTGAWTCSDPAGATSITCTRSDSVPVNIGAGTQLTTALILTVNVDPTATGVVTTAFEVSGGGGVPDRTVDPTRVDPGDPGFGVDAFDGEVIDAAGLPYTQAAGHPYAITTWIDFNRVRSSQVQVGGPAPVEAVKDIVVDLPPGLVGNPTATGDFKCTVPELANGGIQDRPLCPSGSQVGTASILATGGTVAGFSSAVAIGPVAVYNMVPPPNIPARFGFNVSGTVVTLDAAVRSESDYGLTVRVRNISEGLAVVGTSLTFWGVPADSSHDAQRTCPGELEPWNGGPTCTTDAPLKPFLRNPTACAATDGSSLLGLETVLYVDSWVRPGRLTSSGKPDLTDPNWKGSSFISHVAPGYPLVPDLWGAAQLPTACEDVPFDAEFAAAPSGPGVAGAPSGYRFDLSVDQPDNPNAVGAADLKKAVVTLPQGLRVSPSSANGLAGCTQAQVALDTLAEPSCPDGSKIGTVQIDTPLLEQPLSGGVYLATPHDNKFGALLALYIVARGPGLIVKLPGTVDANSKSGQLTATFDNNPQLPFSNLQLVFKDGARSPLVNPRACGIHHTSAELISWSGATVVSRSSFTLSKDGHGAGCSPPTFTPGFDAGTENPIAGAHSDFLLRLSRDDEDQELKSLSVDLPDGLTGRIASAVLCAEGDAGAGSCPEGSRVGSVTVGAGAGTNPFYITNGRAYLTGPYRGAPFGLSIVVPAVAGPFDLGTVVVRSALFVDKHDATVRVVSDPLPTILEGIPLDVRDVRVAIDRDGFFINPTSCAEKTIRGTIESTEGSTADVSSRFQVGECANLSMRPRMSLRVGGRGSTSRGRPTGFSTRLRMPGRDSANLRFVRVTLPSVLNARLTVINDACTREEFERGDCAHARAGTATAVTPLLRDPLKGSVYFVRNGNPLPDLFVALRGQVAFDLVGKITIPGSTRLRTTFSTIPDVPISSFTLKLFNGRNASVGNAANLCSRRARSAKAELDFIGQNGKVVQIDKRLDIRGCGSRGRGGRRRRR